MTGAIKFWNELSVPKEGMRLRADVEVVVAEIVTHGQDVVALENLKTKKQLYQALLLILFSTYDALSHTFSSFTIPQLLSKYIVISI